MKKIVFLVAFLGFLGANAATNSHIYAQAWANSQKNKCAYYDAICRLEKAREYWLNRRN